MNKKILGVLLVLIATVAIGSVVYASETVTIDGFDFNVPDGFTEDESHETVNVEKEIGGIKYVNNGKLFQNSEGDVVNILVADYGDYEVTDEIAAGVADEPKTIGGIDGYIQQNGTFTSFDYAKDGKLVVITTNNEDAIEGFIIE